VHRTLYTFLLVRFVELELSQSQVSWDMLLTSCCGAPLQSRLALVCRIWMAKCHAISLPVTRREMKATAATGSCASTKAFGQPTTQRIPFAAASHRPALIAVISKSARRGPPEGANIETWQNGATWSKQTMDQDRPSNFLANHVDVGDVLLLHFRAIHF